MLSGVKNVKSVRFQYTSKTRKTHYSIGNTSLDKKRDEEKESEERREEEDGREGEVDRKKARENG
eukprot:1349070-Amorphochlora_amoeboformis.AAC.1